MPNSLTATTDKYPLPVTSPAVAQRRRRRAAFFVAGLGLSGVLVLAGSIAFVRLSAAAHLHTEDSVPAAPVALVLGARVYPSGTPSPFLAARLDVAHRLYQAGKVRVVLDGEMLKQEPLNYHPLRNDRTIAVSAADLLKFIADCGHEPMIAHLPELQR